MTLINTVIVKTSTTCNLGCSYCYATDKTGHIKQEKIISKETTETIIEKSLLSAGNKIEYIWHGGEPLLLGIDYYEWIIELQKKYSKPNTKIINSIQTNATLITPKWASFFAENSFGPGVSLDGPKDIHDSNRKFASNKGSFDRVMKGISHLNEKGIYPNILAVVSKNSLNRAQEIFDFFVENSILNFDFLPYAEFDEVGKLEPLSITADEFGRFMKDVFDIWMKKNNPKIEIRLLHNAMLGLMGGILTLCNMSGICANFFAVGSDGDVYHCDWFIGQDDDCFGNINSESFDDISNKAEYKNYVAQIRKEKAECQNCKWLFMCNGGCSHYRKTMGGFDKPYYFCESRKMLFGYMESRLSSLQVPTIVKTKK